MIHTFHHSTTRWALLLTPLLLGIFLTPPLIIPWSDTLAMLPLTAFPAVILLGTSDCLPIVVSHLPLRTANLNDGAKRIQANKMRSTQASKQGQTRALPP